MKYSKFEVEKVKRDADIRRIIPGTNATNPNQYIECPFCHEPKKFRVRHTAQYNCAFCVKCNQGFSNPIVAYAHYNNLDVERDFLKCLEGAAQQCGVIITPEETRRKETVKSIK